MLRIAVFALALFAAVPARAQEAPSDLPDTPVARVFRAWLRAINSGDSASAREFAIQHGARDPDDIASVQRAIRAILMEGEELRGCRIEQW